MCITFGQFSIKVMNVVRYGIICQMSAEICSMINMEGFKNGWAAKCGRRYDDNTKYKLGVKRCDAQMMLDRLTVVRCSVSHSQAATSAAATAVLKTTYLFKEDNKWNDDTEFSGLEWHSNVNVNVHVKLMHTFNASHKLCVYIKWKL